MLGGWEVSFICKYLLGETTSIKSSISCQGREYLCHSNWQMLQVRAFSFSFQRANFFFLKSFEREREREHSQGEGQRKREKQIPR